MHQIRSMDDIIMITQSMNFKVLGYFFSINIGLFPVVILGHCMTTFIGYSIAHSLSFMHT